MVGVSHIHSAAGLQKAWYEFSWDDMLLVLIHTQNEMDTVLSYWNSFCPFGQALGIPQSPGLNQYITGKTSCLSGNLDTAGAEGSPNYIRNDTLPLPAKPGTALPGTSKAC